MGTDLCRSSLDDLVIPRSAAVIGASDDPARIGGRVFDYLRADLGAAAVPVNPTRDTVQGVPAVPSVADLAEVPDLAVIALPAPHVTSAVRDCVARGVRTALVLSGGFAETAQGADLQSEIAGIAREGGLRLAGPNCMGVLNLADGVRPTFMRLVGSPMRSGTVAIVSQSGAMGVQLFDQAQMEGLGISQLCMTGNEADVTAIEMIEYLLERDDVRVVLAMIEGIKDGERLVRAGRRGLELGKPIVAMKVGGSPTGSRAILRHTGSQPVPDPVVDAAFESAGIVRVQDPRRLLDLGKAFAACRIPRGNRVVVVTGSGGAGVLMADDAERNGLELPVPSPGLQERIGEFVPWFGSAANPIDHTAQIINDLSKLEDLVHTVLDSDEFDAVVSAVPGKIFIDRLRDCLADNLASNDKPVIVWTYFPDEAEKMVAAGIPSTVESTEPMPILRAMLDYGLRCAELAEERCSGRDVSATGPVLGPADPRGVLDPECVRKLTQAYGLPLAREPHTVIEEQALADEFGVGPSSGPEFTVQAGRDARFGPVLSVGQAGAVGEPVVVLAPVTSAAARRGVARLAGCLPQATRDALAEVLVRVGEAFSTEKRLESMALTGLSVSADGLVVVGSAQAKASG